MAFFNCVARVRTSPTSGDGSFERGLAAGMVNANDVQV
jgi:hypothetical protein